ncbi:MAG: DUF2147 domain-containing protein [Pseudomonadota bacterium]
MTRIMTAILASLALTGAAQADPAFGTWASPKNEAGASLQVEVAACGTAICGKITKVTGGDQSIVGDQLVWDMQARGGGEYRGKIWAPDTNKTYNGRMELNGNKMKMSGCVLGVCRGETFTRVN